MIKLTKIQKPGVLEVNEQKWLEKVLSPNCTEGDKIKYKHPEIKAALIEELHGKCAYCESKILHTDFGHIEHFKPKKLYRELIFQWDNLTLACTKCNLYKASKDPVALEFISPYLDNPSEHICFWGPFFSPKSTLAINTETHLKLNRPELVEARNERIKDSNSIISTLNNMRLPRETRQEIYDEFIESKCSEDSEFSAMFKDFIPALKAQLPNDIEV